MKKITQIKINNYKAYIEEEVINLPQGENLLIYGENGSGKSSLFYALHYFFKSSVYPDLNFDLNCFSPDLLGKIEITFSDYIEDKECIDENIKNIYTAFNESDKSTNVDSDIKHGYRLSGFLDYSQLLKVYLTNEDQPNLFYLVNELLGDYVPTKYGFHNTISELFHQIHDFTTKSYHRTDYSYLLGKSIFTSLQLVYCDIINDLNTEFSRLMSDYFDDFRLDIKLVKAKINLNEKLRIVDTKIEGSLFIDVKHHGANLPAYNNRLNEARLSAIAICLYLATLKLKNQNSEIKLLYLDDVFVGLDSANRRPILNIIRKEFISYQIMISTYDKSWYRLAKEILSSENNWKFLEMYEREHHAADGLIVSKPLLIYSQSMIDKARKYLYDRENPDYPAAANYMRKSFEELLVVNNYRPFVVDDNMELIKAYKIPKLIQSTRNLLSRMKFDSHTNSILNLLSELISYLKPMLHPLSHYAPDEPVYRAELMRAEQLYDRLKLAFMEADYKNNCEVVVPKGGQLMLKINSSGIWRLEIELEMDEHLIIYKGDHERKYVSTSPLHIVCQKFFENGELKSTFEVNKKQTLFSNFCYENLEDCVGKLDAFLCSKHYTDRILLPNIFEMYYLIDTDTSGDKKIIYETKLSSKM